MFLAYHVIDTAIVAATPINSLGELTPKGSEQAGYMRGGRTTQPTSSRVVQVLGPHYLVAIVVVG